MPSVLATEVLPSCLGAELVRQYGTPLGIKQLVQFRGEKNWAALVKDKGQGGTGGRLMMETAG